MAKFSNPGTTPRRNFVPGKMLQRQYFVTGNIDTETKTEKVQTFKRDQFSLHNYSNYIRVCI